MPAIDDVGRGRGEGEGEGEGDGSPCDPPCGDGQACSTSIAYGGITCSTGCIAAPKAGDVCAESPGEDGDCSVGVGFQVDCAPGLTCAKISVVVSDVTGYCVAPGTSGVDVACVGDEDCAPGLFCLGSNTDDPTLCRCSHDAPCDGLCEPLSTTGEQCSTADDGCSFGSAIECAPGLRCAGSTCSEGEGEGGEGEGEGEGGGEGEGEGGQ